jgi:hypothetical protein
VNHLYRLQMLGWIFFFTASAISSVGEFGKCDTPFTWNLAWLVGGTVSFMAWLGWQARGEHDAAASGEAK